MGAGSCVRVWSVYLWQMTGTVVYAKWIFELTCLDGVCVSHPDQRKRVGDTSKQGPLSVEREIIMATCLEGSNWMHCRIHRMSNPFLSITKSSTSSNHA